MTKERTIQGASEGLPDPSRAFALICECFGLNRTPESKVTDPTGKLRQGFHRFFNSTRAKQSDLARSRMEQLLYSLFRRHERDDFGHAYAVMDETAAITCYLYQELSGRLNPEGRSPKRILWLLAEHVLVPTLLAIWARHWPTELGHEFAGDQSWYLPVTVGAEVDLPFARVFSYWMRVAGIRSTNQLATMLLESGCCPKSERVDTLRKKLDRWKRGEGLVSLTELYGYLDALETEVEWLAEPGDWKARFALALAMQRFFEKADRYFKNLDAKPSSRFAAWFRTSARNGILTDDDGFLAEPTTCFAIQSIQKRLKKNGVWSKLAAAGQSQMWFGAGVSEEEIRRRIAEGERNAKVGNRLVDWIRREAESSGRLSRGNNSSDYRLSLQRYIFDLGVREIQMFVRCRQKEPDEHEARQA